MAAQTATETRAIVTGRRSLSVSAPRKHTHKVTASILLIVKKVFIPKQDAAS